MTKICHLTSVHHWGDVRIFIKECVSLAKQFDEVYLIAPGTKKQVVDKVNIIPVHKFSRLKRMRKTVDEVYKKSLEIDADVYHLHDPELLRIALRLKKKGKKVIFDIHENVALQIKSKPYIPSIFRGFIGFMYRMLEKFILPKLDGLILAEDSYLPYYDNLNKNISIVLNMPQHEKFDSFQGTGVKKDELFYIGSISEARGIITTLNAIKILKDRDVSVKFNCVGVVPGWLESHPLLTALSDRVIMHGRLPLYEGLEYAKSAKIGLSILKPIENYKNSFSTKTFEYMAMGLPVITSNFKLYKDVIEFNHTGLCINPQDPLELANSIERLLKDDDLCKTMGENGIQLIAEKYNWKNEEAKLFNLYQTILN